MQNQRLLYSDSKRARAGSISKENNIKLINDSLAIESLGDNKKVYPELRFNYDNNTRIPGKSLKTVSEDIILSKPLEKSPLKTHLEHQQPPKIAPIPSSHLSNRYQPRTNSLLSSQQQIQSYTNKLLQNNQSYQNQIFQLKQQNAKIRSQLQKSIAQNIKFRMSAQKKEQQIKKKFDVQISQLVKELKQILQAKQEMQTEYNNYIQQLVEEHAKELDGREEAFSKSEQFFKEKLSNLKNHLSLNKEEKEKQYFQASEFKLRLIKQIDQLNYSIENEKIDKRQLQKSNDQMVKIIKNLEKELKQTKQTLEKAQLQVFKIQKDKNQIIIQLKSQNKSLCDVIKSLQTKIQQLDHSLFKKQQEFSKLQDQILSMKKDLDQKTKINLQKNIQLQNSKALKKLLEEKNQKLSQTLLQQKSNDQLLIEQLQNSIRTLSSELSQTQIRHNSLQKQKILLNSQVQTFSKENAKLMEEINKLEELNKKYKKDNIQFLQELQFLSLQNKSLKEEKALKDNHLRTLEQMCEQLQKNREKHKQAEFEKFKFLEHTQILQAVRIKERNNQVAQIEKLLREKYDSELLGLKEENKSLKGQIQHIVGEYERKLMQKQEKWQLRVQNIQKDLQNLISADKIKNLSNRKGEQRQLQSRYTKIQASERKQSRSPYIIKNNIQDDRIRELQLRADILSSLTRRDVIRNNQGEDNSSKKLDYIKIYDRKVQNEEQSFRKRDNNKYYENSEKRLKEFSNSRRINY